MISTRCVAGVLAAAALGVGLPASLVAQRANGLLAGVGPVGAQGLGTGVHAELDYVAALPVARLSARIEGSVSAWSRSVEAAAQASRRLSSVGVAVERPFGEGRLQPFLVLGAAAYARPGLGFDGGGSAGVGIRYTLGSISLHSEVRMHRIAGDNLRGPIPFVLGIQFR